MKKLALFLFLLGLAFFGAAAAARRLNVPIGSKPLMLSKSEFKPTAFPLKNRSFTIVIVGVNNGAAVAKTLASVFSQNYENYKVIYIDDASDDGSFDLARDLIYESGHLLQVTLVHNETRLGPLANVCRAVQTLADDEIVLILQGEDWLAHEWVLQKLNGYYANCDLWLTFGHYKDFPTYQTGPCPEFIADSFRTANFVPMHLKTFYAGLFKQVREADFQSGGKFLTACSEMAYMIPMLEMAKNHAHFIPEILYISNRQASYKEERELQLHAEKFIRALDRYQPLAALKVNPCGE